MMSVFDDKHFCDECAIYDKCESILKKQFATACDEFIYTEEMMEQHYDDLAHYPFHERWYQKLVDQGLRPDENGIYRKNTAKQYDLPRNASDARKRTTYIEKDIPLDKEVEWCEKRVLEAISCHQFSTYVDWISNSAREALERKGYVITKGSENAYNSGFTLHWDHPAGVYDSLYSDNYDY